MSEYQNFADFGLSPETLAALAAKGFETPSPIQQIAIPALLENRCDLIAQAQTGTGKTAAYGIPIIEALRRDGAAHGPAPRALVLAPTRELAMQIATELESLAGDRSMKFLAVYGGQPVEFQLPRLKSGIDVVIGTPGRVIDLHERGALVFDDLKFAVLDEADEMLDMGFVEDIEAILSGTPVNKRMLMFSATMPAPIREIAERFMQKPESVSTRPARLDAGNTEQIAHEVRREDKLAALERVLAAADDPYAMVFCRTRADVDDLTLGLQQLGFPAEALHGDLAQTQRTRIIGRFKSRQFRILIATDVAARGIDVNDLTHVINYSLPQSPDIYIHRIGRTGRAGKSGIAITFATPGERRKLDTIRREVRSAIELAPLPDGRAMVGMKKRRFAARLEELPEGEIPESCRNFADELLAAGTSPETVVARILQLRFGDELDPGRYPELGQRRAPLRGKQWVELPVGRDDGYTPAKLMNAIYEQTRIWKSKMGRILIGEEHSAIELPAEAAQVALRGLGGARLIDPPAEAAAAVARPARSPRPTRAARMSRERSEASEGASERSTSRPGRPARAESAERPGRPARAERPDRPARPPRAPRAESKSERGNRPPRPYGKFSH